MLVPGFVAFVIFRRIAAVEQRFSDFETTVWSLFVTLAIYSLYGALIGVSTIDDLGTYVSQPIHLGELLALTVGGTAVIAAVIKVTFRKNVQIGDCWDIFRLKPAAEGAWLIVYTVDGLEYKGTLHTVGWGRSKRELVLREPKLIVRDKRNWKILDEIEYGRQMLFTEPDIRRVAFLTDLETKDDV